ncbi:MAG TPA: carboxypeptidase-like regulatory domain-containing protein [Bryobacteraceae bacterium]|nr:carboxypeptidase-like regulatory domain-containing protein [Bryobacteraceae bacterium]
MRWVPLLAVCSGILCAQEAAKSGTVHGVVTDEATGLPISGVMVQAALRRELPGGAMIMFAKGGKTTDDQGRYVLTDVPPGTPVITVNTPNSWSVTHSIALHAGQDVEVDFSMPARPRIAGRVLDEDRTPVKGASVWVIESNYVMGKLRRQPASYVSTDKAGRFVFDELLQAGRGYYLVAKGAAGVPIFYGGSTSLEAAAPIVLGSGELRQQADIVLPTAALTHCVQGTVKAGGKPLGTDLTIELSALARAGIALEPRVQSAGDGTFRACGLAAGDYTISGPDRHFRDEQSFTIADSDVHGVELNLDPALVRREFVWEGDPPAEPTEEPAAAESKSPSPLDFAEKQFGSPMGREVVLPLNGVRFRARIPYSDAAPVEMSAGDFPLSVQLSAGCYVKEITYGGVPLIDGVLHLIPGSSGTLRIVAAQGGATISAKVEDGEGQPIRDTVVAVIPEGVETAPQFAMQAHQADADPGGNFTSETLAPGKYRVLALTRRYKPTEEDMAKLLALLLSARKVEVGRNENVHLTLHPVSID